MKLSRRLRFLAAFLALTGVLLSQLAVSAYACPGQQSMALAALDLEPGTDMPCCGDGVPDSQPALCAAHCQQGDQSLDKPAAPALPALVPIAILPGLAAANVAGNSVAPGEQRSLLARKTAPSVALRHCCLRI
ncbi:MAG: hypothetical protein ABI669_04545 [Usitatibacter sp.]